MTTPIGTLQFEGKPVDVLPSDTVASALYRSGVRVFSRSLKYHRKRGLFCLTGDCPNCFVNIDRAPAVRSCCTPASPGMIVKREGGWPNVENDLLAINDRLHWALPAGFYYKTFLRPRWAWPVVEGVIRKMTGLGAIDLTREPAKREQLHHHPDLLVIGAGVAGLAAALEAANAGESVLLCEQGEVGDRIASLSTLARARQLHAEAVAHPDLLVLERCVAVGVYEGPLVPLNGRDFLHLVHPRRIVVATGAVEVPPVLAGNDLPGVFLSRGAALLAAKHALLAGSRVVAVGDGPELAEHTDLLEAAGAQVIQMELQAVRRIDGRGRPTGVVTQRQTTTCDAVIFACGFVPRDSLLRQGSGLPVVGAGDVVLPGCSLAAAEASGREAGVHGAANTRAVQLPAPPREGYVCLCEDVTVAELELAWQEGFESSELVKRYTTITMGPCQGLLCQQHLRAFLQHKGVPDTTSSATTARPPSGGLTLEDAAAGLHDEHLMLTRLHAHHLAAGATTEPTGGWLRPSHYGDVEAEYWAVRERVSLMDIGTLGKFLVGGRDALTFLERLYPNRVADIEEGRLRYALLLAPTGFVIDDGTIAALGDGRYYLTFSSVGAAVVESILRDWAETWAADVHIVNLTVARGAINVAGPKARNLLGQVAERADLTNEALPYLSHRELEVAGVRCRVIRLGFVGELSYELHHPSRSSVKLWDALSSAGRDFDTRPHGLEALRLLRLEKGHVMIGQDTDYDTTPEKLGMTWAAKLDKHRFVGKAGLLRASAQPITRRLSMISFDGERAPAEGSAVLANGRYVGHLSSSRFSPVLGHGVALGWVDRVGDDFPLEVEADGVPGKVTTEAFYDPKGTRLRA